MNNTEVDVRIQFMCEQDGVPICMNMGFTLSRSPYAINSMLLMKMYYSERYTMFRNSMVGLRYGLHLMIWVKSLGVKSVM